MQKEKLKKERAMVQWSLQLPRIFFCDSFPGLRPSDVTPSWPPIGSEKQTISNESLEQKNQWPLAWPNLKIINLVNLLVDQVLKGTLYIYSSSADVWVDEKFN